MQSLSHKMFLHLKPRRAVERGCNFCVVCLFLKNLNKIKIKLKKNKAVQGTEKRWLLPGVGNSCSNNDLELVPSGSISMVKVVLFECAG